MGIHPSGLSIYPSQEGVTLQWKGRAIPQFSRLLHCECALPAPPVESELHEAKGLSGPQFSSRAWHTEGTRQHLLRARHRAKQPAWVISCNPGAQM